MLWPGGSLEKSALFLSSVMTNLYASFCFLYMLFRLSGSAVIDLKHFMAVSTLKLSSDGPNTGYLDSVSAMKCVFPATNVILNVYGIIFSHILMRRAFSRAASALSNMPTKGL